MATLTIHYRDGRTETLSYCMTHMTMVILGIYGTDDREPWIDDYTLNLSATHVT